MLNRILTIPIKGIYFDQIKAGIKPWEYRIVSPFWRKRLMGRAYDWIVLTRGYPKKTDTERRLTVPWRGYEVQTITHEHFGPDPVQVYAICVAFMGERQTGRTTRAMLALPHGAIYVWCNSDLFYPRALAKHIGRPDLQIVRRSLLDRPSNVLIHKPPGFAVDHACFMYMSRTEFDGLSDIRRRLKLTL